MICSCSASGNSSHSTAASASSSSRRTRSTSPSNSSSSSSSTRSATSREPPRPSAPASAEPRKLSSSTLSTLRWFRSSDSLKDPETTLPLLLALRGFLRLARSVRSSAISLQTSSFSRWSSRSCCFRFCGESALRRSSSSSRRSSPKSVASSLISCLCACSSALAALTSSSSTAAPRYRCSASRCPSSSPAGPPRLFRRMAPLPASGVATGGSSGGCSSTLAARARRALSRLLAARSAVPTRSCRWRPFWSRCSLPWSSASAGTTGPPCRGRRRCRGRSLLRRSRRRRRRLPRPHGERRRSWLRPRAAVL
mmetsp:Transcript_91119/g.256817  ORF Transcript_91119/g.256817 Transcript_91119/m.256817 type:complete len:310 (+) Transcript_91119:1522-2451(+)